MTFLMVLAVAALLAGVWWWSRHSGGVRPPGTTRLDEDTDLRPELDPAALAAARARVSQDIPDEVLADMLLDASPQQAARMFSAVPASVMAEALGKDTMDTQSRASAAELAQLRGAGNAVDELEIFNLGSDDSTERKQNTR